MNAIKQKAPSSADKSPKLPEGSDANRLTPLRRAACVALNAIFKERPGSARTRKALGLFEPDNSKVVEFTIQDLTLIFVVASLRYD
ncbi:MAG: hypothetical protein HQ519_03790 [Planctomycetes bacterium]|nr:hypothetical protein [Planctomycetota bacterium]